MKINEIVYNRYDVNNLINVYEKAKIEIENAKNVDDILKARNVVVKEYAKLDTAYNLAYIRWSQNTVSEFSVFCR